MHNLYSNFRKFLKITKSVLKPHLLDDGNIGFYPNPPNMPDLEIIALSVMSEALSISSENLLFSKLRSDYSQQFPCLISRPRFNIRRRKLQSYIHQVCLGIAKKMQTKGEALIIDSIPLPICANPRIMRSTSCKEDELVQPDRGYHASHKQFYYGFKMQLLITEKGVPLSGSLFPASCHDTQALTYLQEDGHQNCELIADKGYISTNQQLTLFNTLSIKLITPLRSNMKKAISYWNSSYRYKRKRIETLFSQLTNQMNLKANFAKTLDGLFTRVITKLAAVAVLQFINAKNHRPVNHLKHALAF